MSLKAGKNSDSHSVTDHIEPSSQSIQDLCVWLFWSLSVVGQVCALESLQSVLNARRFSGSMCWPWVQLRVALGSGLMPVEMAATMLCWTWKSWRVSNYQNVCSAKRHPYSYWPLTPRERNLAPPSCQFEIKSFSLLVCASMQCQTTVNVEETKKGGGFANKCVTRKVIALTVAVCLRVVLCFLIGIPW